LGSAFWKRSDEWKPDVQRMSRIWSALYHFMHVSSEKDIRARYLGADEEEAVALEF
jgi:hypothetical protein